MYPLVGELIKCEYCSKRINATEDMEPWISISQVRAGREDHVAYFCRYSCLQAWADESESMFLARKYQETKDDEWKREEMKGVQ